MSEFGFGSTDTLIDETVIPVAGDEIVDDSYEFAEDEGGSFPPRLLPGPVRFRYEVTKFTDGGEGPDFKSAASVEYTAHVQTANLGPGRLLKQQGLTEIPVKFNRASAFRSEAMKSPKPSAKNPNPKGIPSNMQRLYSALGLKEEFGPPKSHRNLCDMIRNASGRFADGTIVWRATNKRADGTYEIFCTSPNTKRKVNGKDDPEKAWPLNADGTLKLEVTFEDGTVKQGREEIGRVNTPKAKKSA